MDMFQLDLFVQGHHVHKNIWNSLLGEELECMCKTRNVHDFYAVGVVKTGTGTVNLLYHDMVNSALALL